MKEKFIKRNLINKKFEIVFKNTIKLKISVRIFIKIAAYRVKFDII